MAFPPVQDPAYGLSAEALEYARQRYEETEDSQRSIAEDIGKSRGTLDRIAKAQGWKLRKDQPPRGLSEALKLRIAATENVDVACLREPDQSRTRCRPAMLLLNLN